MQKTYHNLTAKQIIQRSITDDRGFSFCLIDGKDFQVTTHDCVELNNGNWAATVVLTHFDGERIVLAA